MTYQVILCFKHGYYKGVMCPICNHMDMIYTLRERAEKPNERNSLAYPVTVEFRQSNLLEFF